MTTRRQDLIAECLTEIDVQDLELEKEDCSICLQSLLSNAQAEDIPNPERPVQLKCGHIYGQDCITHWLSSNETCPQCRAAVLPATHPNRILYPDGYPDEATRLDQWRLFRTDIIEVYTRLDAPHDTMEVQYRRLGNFIERETNSDAEPNDYLWMAITHFRNYLGDMTNAYLQDLIDRWESYPRFQELRERTQREIMQLLVALRQDIRLNPGT